MILSNINNYLTILSTIFLVNSNIGFNMEKQNQNNINNSRINITSNNNCVDTNQTHEKVSRNLNMSSKTNTIQETNPFPNCLVLNSNKIIVRNPNFIHNSAKPQVFQCRVQSPTVIYKKVVVRRKNKELTNKKVTKNIKEIYNENNFKADIDYFDKGIFYEPDVYDDNMVIQDWNVERNNNYKILDNYIKFMYNNVETNLNIKIGNIKQIINNLKNTNNYTYYK